MATQVPRQTDRAITSTRKRKATFDESSPAGLPRADTVSFGRETCGSLEQSEQREWLVTNGIGGFASGTISGNLDRRYHVPLFAALNAPIGRIQMVAKLAEAACYDGAGY